MRKFLTHSGIVAPLNWSNINTDMIIPKQFLKSIKRTGFGINLFDEVRYVDEGEMNQKSRSLNPDFVLNQPRYQSASILLTGKNFGCGSSREHAPWALCDFGFRCIIAPSFAEIFYNNCFKNGLLAITLEQKKIDELFAQVDSCNGYQLHIDLKEKKIILPNNIEWSFVVDDFRWRCLLDGLDDISLTLQDAENIIKFEKLHEKKQPWLFLDSLS